MNGNKQQEDYYGLVKKIYGGQIRYGSALNGADYIFGFIDRYCPGGKAAALTYIGYLPLLACIYRMLSRNINRRRMENYKFSMLISPLYSWFRKMRMRITEGKTHRFYTCPKCKAHLRLPRGKGKIIVTCPKCKTEFRAKS